MIISLTPEKATKLKRLCLAAIDKQKISIRTLAQLVVWKEVKFTIED